MLNLKIIIRSILRQKLSNSIIVISLAIGVSCISLIGIFVTKELKTDSFNKNSNEIYALSYDNPIGKVQKNYNCYLNSVAYIPENFSQIKDFCFQWPFRISKIGVGNDYYYDKPGALKVSKNFFEFFNFELHSNNPATVLQLQNSVVISENLAMKYFGTLDAEGKTIIFFESNKKEEMIVSAVFQKPKENSHLDFEMAVLIDKQIPNWKSCFCYFRLQPNTNPNQLISLINGNFKNLPVITAFEGMSLSYNLQPIREMYFDPDYYGGRRRDKTDLYVALIIGLLILIIATFNYLGLINNKLIDKAQDFAIQRIHGGSKRNFIQSFMFEHILLIAFSFLISTILIVLISPYFNEITSSNIDVSYLFQPQQLLIQFGIVLLILTATFFFALLKINRTTLTTSIVKKQISTKLQLPVFSIFQFTGTVALIISSVVIIKQINYIMNMPIGIDKEVMQIIPGQFSNTTLIFKEELLKNSAIEYVSVTGTSPLQGGGLMNLNFVLNGKKIDYSPVVFQADGDYIKTMGIKLLQGESFSGNPNTDYNKCLINQTFAKKFPDQYLVGKELPGKEDSRIIGIVEDFHYSNLKSIVEPAIIFSDVQPFYPALLIKAHPNQNNQARKAIVELWARLIPDYPVEISTMGETYEIIHRENKNYLKLIGSCCAISIFLSMIGLFAISVKSSQRRTKEIGIRKVNGAKISEILAMLNRDFVKWVAIAFVIATPIAYYAMHKWLENFAYKTELSWWIFALAGLLALGVAFLTVSWQSWRAATRNPVEALRYE
jgi:putative ABC transport system permease protein